MKVFILNTASWIKLILLTFIIAVSACGGGGDGDDEEDEVVIKSLYDFTIGGPISGDGDSYINITRGEDFSLEVEPSIVGSLDCNQTTEICNVQYLGSLTNVPTTILIENPGEEIFADTLTITLDGLILFNSTVSDNPTSGTFLIDRSQGNDISVEITSCTGGSVEVTSTTTNCYSWSDFEDLTDNPGASDDALAALVFEVVTFIVEQGLNTLEVFPLLVDDVFATTNPLFDQCEDYEGSWVGGPPVPGGFELLWDDANSNSQVGPGDSLSQTFTECWLGDVEEGVLINGMIDHEGYLEVIDSLGLLTRIGFNYVELGSGLAPIVYTGTTNVGGIIETDPPLSITGRFAIDFN
ncbi:MAG: hypothetical protein QNJ56_09075 [Gammaproteobacteria bacterium]|nr:hypothetical protein [Gammaproteobacteria bacterium]